MHDVVSDPRWFLLAGATLVLMALSSSVLRRLPLTASILYLALGFAAGPAGFGLIRVDPVGQSGLLELFAELAVIVSLFTAGLKLREPLSAGRWRGPVRLAVVSMAVTIALVAAAGGVWLGLPLGAAVLLGAILAPTDPVLAAEVQVASPTELEDVRFGLTGEAGLNDGSAFPFVLLGLGLLGLHELGPLAGRWLVVDVIWAAAGGLAIGGLAGTAVGRLVVRLRRDYREALGLHEFIGLGLIGLAYGLAVVLGTYGFLAVFAAGLAVRRIELQTTGREPVDPEVVEAPARARDPLEAATDPERAPAYMASELLGFNEQLERIGEIALVVLVGAMLATVPASWTSVAFAVLLFAVIRPVSVVVGLAGSGTSRVRVAVMGWFGMRGIGSLYYLFLVTSHGLDDALARELAAIVLTVVALSIVVHGVSVTPLMERYDRWRAGRSSAAGSAAGSARIDQAG